jgi:hypothetical protein
LLLFFEIRLGLAVVSSRCESERCSFARRFAFRVRRLAPLVPVRRPVVGLHRCRAPLVAQLVCDSHCRAGRLGPVTVVRISLVWCCGSSWCNDAAGAAAHNAREVQYARHPLGVPPPLPPPAVCADVALGCGAVRGTFATIACSAERPKTTCPRPPTSPKTSARHQAAATVRRLRTR